MPADKIPVSVAVCVRNRVSDIGACLESVLLSDPAEVVVIDGDSTDGTAERAQSLGVKVVSDGKRGLGAARQLAAKLATQPYIAYVDSDARLTPTTLRMLWTEAQGEALDAVQARLLPLGDELSYWQREESWRRAVQEPPGPALVIGCQATLIRRDLVLEVRFDPAFSGAAEDHDFSFRATRLGNALGFSRTAVAYHRDRMTFPEFARQRLWYGRGMTRLFVRHRRLAPQGRSAIGAAWQAPSHFPYLVVSWACTVA